MIVVKSEKEKYYTFRNKIFEKLDFFHLTAFATRDIAAEFSYLYRIYAMITDTKEKDLAHPGGVQAQEEYVRFTREILTNPPRYAKIYVI